MAQPAAEGTTSRDAERLRNADIPAHFLFAYAKTGLMVTAENITQMSLDSLRRWDAAIAEYFQCERQGKAGSTSRLLH